MIPEQDPSSRFQPLPLILPFPTCPSPPSSILSFPQHSPYPPRLCTQSQPRDLLFLLLDFRVFLNLKWVASSDNSRSVSIQPLTPSSPARKPFARMLNVKSRKLVLTLFCSLALVLVLTGGASASAQLNGHRMLRKRSPALLERQIIDTGAKGEGSDPNNGNNGSSSSSSSTLSRVSVDPLTGRMLNDVNVF